MRLRGVLATALAIASGVLVLAGYFIALPVLVDLRIVLLDWAVILAAFAIFVGVVNLILVHISKIRQRQKGLAYSFLLIISLVVTLLLGLGLGPQNKLVSNFFTYVQLPVETSLMALLAVTLVYASIRLLRRRLTLVSVLFLITALLVLLGTAPVPYLGRVMRPFITQVFAAGGARGILIGVALGTLTTGLRILFGADRPYGGDRG